MVTNQRCWCSCCFSQTPFFFFLSSPKSEYLCIAMSFPLLLPPATNWVLHIKRQSSHRGWPGWRVADEEACGGMIGLGAVWFAYEMERAGVEGAELTSMTFPAVSLDFGRLSGWGRGESCRGFERVTSGSSGQWSVWTAVNLPPAALIFTQTNSNQIALESGMDVAQIWQGIVCDSGKDSLMCTRYTNQQLISGTAVESFLCFLPEGRHNLLKLHTHKDTALLEALPAFFTRV